MTKEKKLVRFADELSLNLVEVKLFGNKIQSKYAPNIFSQLKSKEHIDSIVEDDLFEYEISHPLNFNFNEKRTF